MQDGSLYCVLPAPLGDALEGRIKKRACEWLCKTASARASTAQRAVAGMCAGAPAGPTLTSLSMGVRTSAGVEQCPVFAGAACDAALANKSVFVRLLAGMKGLGGCLSRLGVSAMLPLQHYCPSSPMFYQRCSEDMRAGLRWSVMAGGCCMGRRIW